MRLEDIDLTPVRHIPIVAGLTQEDIFLVRIPVRKDAMEGVFIVKAIVEQSGSREEKLLATRFEIPGPALVVSALTVHFTLCDAYVDLLKKIIQFFQEGEKGTRSVERPDRYLVEKYLGYPYDAEEVAMPLTTFVRTMRDYPFKTNPPVTYSSDEV